VRGGRIINTSSIVARQAIASSAGYCASKFAIEGFSDCLRIELWRHGTKVILVEPQGFKTPMSNLYIDDAKKLISQADKSIQERYATEEKFFFATAEKNAVSISNETPDIVVDAYIEALSAKFPNTRYPVGRDAVYFLRFISLLPGQVSDILVNIYGVLMYLMPKRN